MTASAAKTFLHGGHVRANGIRQHYLRFGGRGEPLVLIPGITSPAITWGFVGERLGANYDTYILDTRAEWLHTCDDVAIEKSLRGLNQEDIHGDLPAINAPALLLVAGKGGVIDDADIAEVKNLAPSIRVRRIEHCGHMIPFDDLDASLEAVESFLV